jgi:hypothetical protein
MMPTSPIWSMASTFPTFVAVALDGAVEGPEAGVTSEFAGGGELDNQEAGLELGRLGLPGANEWLIAGWRRLAVAEAENGGDVCEFLSAGGDGGRIGDGREAEGQAVARGRRG